MPRHPRRVTRLALAAAATSLVFAFTSARAADLSWSAPTSGRWLDPVNWSTGSLPTPTDTATIAAPGGPYTVTLDAATSVGSLTLNNPDATLLLEPPPSSSLRLTTGDIDIAAGTLAVHTSGINGGEVLILSPSETTPINLTNAGRIDITDDGHYSPTTFANLASLSNSGTIEVRKSLTLPADLPDAVLQFNTQTFTNTGTLRTNSRSQIRVFVTTFNQNAGSIDGVVDFNGSTFNFNGGSASSVLFHGPSTLNIAPTAGPGTFVDRGYLTVGGNFSSDQTLYIDPGDQATLTGPAFTNAGHILVGTDPFYPSNIGSDTRLSLAGPTDTLANTGTLDINSALSGPSIITANVVNTGAVHIASPYFAASASNPTSLVGNWTNSGSITIAPDAYVQLSAGSSFTQNAGGSLTIDTDPLIITSGHFYYNGGTVSGNVSLDHSTVHFAPGLTNASGTFTTTSSVIPFVGDIPAGVTLVQTANPSSAAITLPSFANAGTLATLVNYNSQPAYRLRDNLANGTLTNTGTLTGTVNGVDQGISLLINGTLTNVGTIKAYFLTVREFNQNAGTLDVNNFCNVWQGTFNYNGGTITGKTVGFDTATLNIAPGTGPASFTFYNGNNILHGSTVPGSILALDSLNPPAGGIFTNRLPIIVTADPFTNAGTLSFNSSFLRVNPILTVTGSGALTNTGTLSVLAGYGGTRTINAHITNTGTFSVGPGATLTLTGSLSTTTPLDLQGTLDLRGPLTWSYATTSPADAVRSLLAAGHLTDSAADSSHRLAYADTGTAVAVSLAVTGDANLDGTVNADDYALLDRAYARSVTNAHWSDGDFNYDGAITPDDYLLIDTTLGQSQGLSLALLSTRESQFGDAYVSQLLASVPEPSSLASLLLLLPLTRRRRT